MAKLFRNYNTLVEYEADTNKPVNTVCFIKDAKVIYVDGIRYSYKQLDYLPPAINEAEALEYMGKIIKNAQEVGLIGIPVPKLVPGIYWTGDSNIISISGTDYTAESDNITIDGVEYYQLKLDKDLDNDFYNFNYNYFTNLIFKDVDTSNVTNMSNMFEGCWDLTSLDVSNFDTSNVTDIGFMFSDCGSLTSLDMSGWDISNAIKMNKMLTGCSALKTIRMVGCSQTTIDKIKAQLSTDGITGCTIVTE
jgi:surface protein